MGPERVQKASRDRVESQESKMGPESVRRGSRESQESVS